ncbi:MAG: BufA2 family periplasmic bufferin-type metallophore [Methylococcales bacterium]
MIAKRTSGVLLAVAAAALFMSGPLAAQKEGSAEEAKVKCEGINSCKGLSECATASNACRGQNACQGKGIVNTTAEECKDQGGTVQE